MKKNKKVSRKNFISKKLTIIIGVISVLLLMVIIPYLFYSHISQNQNSQSNVFASTNNPMVQAPNKIGQHWLIVENAASELNQTPVGVGFIQEINNQSTYEIVNTQGVDPLPNATHVESFKSYQDIKTALNQGTIASNIRVILYDNENWLQTPVVEQEQPFVYVPLAETLAHQHGYLFMNAPAADLTEVLDPTASDNYTGYLQMNLAMLSQYTDIFEIQAQNAPSLAEYLSFAKQAVKQAKAANSNAVILVGISAKPNGQPSQILYEEARDMSNFVDGYWFNIVGGDAGVSVALPVILNLQQK